MYVQMYYCRLSLCFGDTTVEQHAFLKWKSPIEPEKDHDQNSVPI